MRLFVPFLVVMLGLFYFVPSAGATGTAVDRPAGVERQVVASVLAGHRGCFVDFGQLPFSAHAAAVVKDIFRLKQTAVGRLSGKTGADRQDGRWILGWFVGYVERNGQPLFFATCIRDDKGPRARELTERILTGSGLL